MLILAGRRLSVEDVKVSMECLVYQGGRTCFRRGPLCNTHMTKACRQGRTRHVRVAFADPAVALLFT